MRSVILTQELMGVVLKLTRKSADMGSLRVSWDAPGSEKVYAGRRNFTQIANVVFSLCFGMFVLSMILFLLCSLDASQQPWLALPRLAPASRSWSVQHRTALSQEGHKESGRVQRTATFEGLGTLFRRGTKSMNELVVAHLSEDTKLDAFRLFMRTLHRSGVTARADIILLFPCSPFPEEMHKIVQEEESYFQKLVSHFFDNSKLIHEEKRRAVPNGWSRIQQRVQVNGEAMVDALRTGSTLSVSLTSNASISKFNSLAFEGLVNENKISQDRQSEGAEKNVEPKDSAMPWDWGSISGYEVAELDPIDSLAAFLDRPSIALRRWFAYQILLGTLKHKYKYVLLTEVGNVLVLGDTISRVRGSNLVYLIAEDRTWMDEAENFQQSENSRSENHALGEVDQTNKTSSKDKSSTDSQMNLSVSESAESEHSNPEINESKTREEEFLNGVLNRKPKQKNISKEKASRRRGLMESVYGQQMWLSLEPEEKQHKVLISNALMGAMRPIRDLINAMPAQIVRVALQRKNKDSFSDQALLNYLIYKSSILGKKVMDHLLIVSNNQSVIHSLSGFHEADIFVRDSRELFVVTESSASRGLRNWDGESFADAIQLDLCSSPLESSLYRDCYH